MLPQYHPWKIIIAFRRECSSRESAHPRDEVLLPPINPAPTTDISARYAWERLENNKKRNVWLHHSKSRDSSTVCYVTPRDLGDLEDGDELRRHEWIRNGHHRLKKKTFGWRYRKRGHQAIKPGWRLDCIFAFWCTILLFWTSRTVSITNMAA